MSQGGRGEYSGIQATGMIEWGQKSKPKKVPGPKFNPQKSHAEFLSQKHFLKALNDMTIMNLYIVLNTPKNPYLNQATQKMLAKIFLPKKILKSKISNPKKFFHHPCHGVPSLGIMLSVFSCQSSHFWTSQSCSVSSNWFSKCKHLFIDKLMITTEPALLLNPGSKL